MEVDISSSYCSGADQKAQTSSGLTFALQALLTRHESYVSESQLEHDRLTAYINHLEHERNSLQTANERVVQENRALLGQLESANASLKDSDSHVKSLEILLRDCEIEVRRLNGLSRRTEELELRVLDLEKERGILSQDVENTKEETRSTIQRWKESELKVRQLEYEIQKIEWEARQDKERHEEVIARLERERVLERELGGAEGRLKGAAALQSLNGKASGTNVVSHFVRDILRDNANLQAGVAELRELLQASNEEVQNLRDQVLQHQPIEYDNSVDDAPRPTALSDQIGWSPTPQVQQEVHVHHHYHAKIAGKNRTPTIRKSSRKRASLGLGMLPSTPESSAPTTPLSGPHRIVSSPILPLALYHPQAKRKRWSVQSAATTSTMLSSFPSSPRSYYEQNSSIFDRLEADEESSRPTSPESAAGHAESTFRARSWKGMVDEQNANGLDDEDGELVDDHENYEPRGGTEWKETSPREAEEIEGNESWSHDLTPKPSQVLLTDQSSRRIDPEPPDLDPVEAISQCLTPAVPTLAIDTIADEPETPGSIKGLDEESTDAAGPAGGFEPDGVSDVNVSFGHRRTSSHESLMSISGMDIHLAKRPTTSTSQSSSLLIGNRAYFTLSPSAARRLPAAQPLATVTEFTALSSMRSFSVDSIISGEPATPGSEAGGKTASVSVEALSGLAGMPKPTAAEQQPPSSSFGRLIGGWVRGKWGIAPMKSTGDLRSVASVLTSSSAEPQSPPPFLSPSGRGPGINQKGAIPGLKPARRLPSTGVEVQVVDEESLRESLAG